LLTQEALPSITEQISYKISNFPNKMLYSEFTYNFSPARITRYYNATGNLFDKTKRLYIANLRISQSFHPLLGVIEVVLRNRLNEILIAHFSDSNWIINQKKGFMSNSVLSGNNYYLKNQILNAENKLNKYFIPITPGKIIGELTFSFWTELFEIYHYRLLSGKPIQIFSSLPTNIKRKQISMELKTIRKFRNRINHNEPVCFNGSSIDFTSANEVYTSIINILNWMEPKLIPFTNPIDFVNLAISDAQLI
jgi:hypothetical protein